MLYSIDIPPSNRPRMSQGVRAVLAMIFLAVVIAMALYFVDRFGGVAMAQLSHLVVRYQDFLSLR